MTTREAADYLKCTSPMLYKLRDRAVLLSRTTKDGDTEWVDEDVIRWKILKDEGVHLDWEKNHGWARQYDVLYCRTEPVDEYGSAAERARAQKARMLRYCEGREINVDVVLTEVRPVCRHHVYYNTDSDVKPTAMYSLLGLLGHNKVRTLIVETRDRLVAIDSWPWFEIFLRNLCGVKDIHVANTTWPTEEQRMEAKGWMTDALTFYKVMSGDVSDQGVLDTFMKGYDPKATFKAMARVEAMILKNEKEARKRARQARAGGPRPKKEPIDRRVMDIDDLV
jgi:hypothetical protein